MPTLAAPTGNEIQTTIATGHSYVRGTTTDIYLTDHTKFASSVHVIRIRNADDSKWCLLVYSTKTAGTPGYISLASATDYALAKNVSVGDETYEWPAGSIVELVTAADEIAQLFAEDGTWTKDRDANGHSLNNVSLLNTRDPDKLLYQAGSSSWANRTYEGYEIFDTSHTYTVGSGQDFETLADAAASITNLILVAYPTIQLQEAITITSTVYFQGLISAGGSLILDLNGYDITIDYNGMGIVAKGPFSFWVKDLNAAAGNASIIAGASAGSSTRMLRFDIGCDGFTRDITFDANSKAVEAMIYISNKSQVQLYFGTAFLDTGGADTYSSAVAVVTGAKVTTAVTAGVSANDFAIASGGMAVDSAGHIHTAAGEYTP